MKYLKVSRDFDPKVIGVNNDFAQAETIYKGEKISLDPEKRKYLETFCKDHFSKRKGIYVDDFENIKLDSIDLFKTKKRAKETDVLEALVDNSHRLLGYAYSVKALNIIEKYRLPPHHKIKANILDFKTEYFLIGFAEVPLTEIDYQKSSFCSMSFETVRYQNYEEYRGSMSSFNEIFLLKDYPYDVIHLGCDLFFLEKIVEEFDKEKLTGFRVEKGR